MHLKLSIYIFISGFSFFLQSQPDIGNLYPDLKKFDFSAVYDSTYGITVYNNLIAVTGGDSVRYDHKGHNAQGWLEDYYKSGTVLHKGYYVDGQIRVFKNFFENGELERSFRLEDGQKSAMTTYYPNGKIHSDITYFGETVTSQKDFFENGMPEYEEETDKSGLIMWKRISYFPDGKIDNSLTVTDKKKKKFISLENYRSGTKKTEGEMKLNTGSYDFEKEGVWNYYDENGKITKTEKYHNGKLDE